MSNIDTSKWEEFRLCDLFEKIQVEKIKGKANDFPTERSSEFCIPLLTAGADNQGFVRYAKRDDCPTILSNVISISANGANTGITFYQDEEFAVLQDAYAIKLINKDIPSKEVGLFLAAAINKAIRDNHDWSNKAGWNNIKTDMILLPVDENVWVPDWGYMERYIAELEERSVKELEERSVKELEAYLVSTGLDDYELTEEDKEVLSLSEKSASYEDGYSEDFDGVWWKEFRIGDLFELEKSKPVLSKMDIQEEGLYPAFSSDTRNNGILGYTDIPDFKIKEGECRAIFGDHTRTMNITREDFSILDNVKILNPYKKDISDECLLYIFTRWKKAVPDRGYARHWKWAKEAEFNLPVLPDGTPDFEYMEKYIRVIEKLTIQGVVEWKDRKIEKTKRIIA